MIESFANSYIRKKQLKAFDLKRPVLGYKVCTPYNESLQIPSIFKQAWFF